MKSCFRIFSYQTHQICLRDNDGYSNLATRIDKYPVPTWSVIQKICVGYDLLTGFSLKMRSARDRFRVPGRAMRCVMGMLAEQPSLLGRRGSAPIGILFVGSVRYYFRITEKIFSNMRDLPPRWMEWV